MVLMRAGRTGAAAIALAAGAASPARAAVVEWVNPGSGSWGVALNWSSSPALPGISDDVVIDRGGGGLQVDLNALSVGVNSLSCRERLRIGGAGSLSIATASTVDGDFQMLETCLISGAGDLTLRGTSEWGGGFMGGTGVTRLSQDATMSLSSSHIKLLQRRFENTGVVSWTDGGLQFLGGSFANKACGHFTAAGPLLSAAPGQTGVFINDGVFEKSGVGETRVLSNVRFDNAGVVQVSGGSLRFGNSAPDGTQFNHWGLARVDSGELRVSSGGASTGEFRVAASGSLIFDGGYTFNAGTTFTGAGTLRLAGGQGVTHRFTDTVQTDVPIVLASRTRLALEGPACVVRNVDVRAERCMLDVIGELEVQGDLLGKNVAGATPGSRLTIAEGGRWLAPNTMELDYVWRFALENHGEIEWDLTGDLATLGVVDNHGEIAGAASSFLLSRNVVNHEDAMFRITGPTRLASTGAGDKVFANHGTLLVDARTELIGDSAGEVRLDNSALVHVRQGELLLRDASQHSGEMRIDAGASAVIDRPTFVAGSLLHCDGVTELYSGLFQGSLTGGGLVDVRGGTTAGAYAMDGSLAVAGHSETSLAALGGAGFVRGVLTVGLASVTGILDVGEFRVSASTDIDGQLATDVLTITSQVIGGAGELRVRKSGLLTTAIFQENLRVLIDPGAVITLAASPSSAYHAFESVVENRGRVVQQTDLNVGGSMFVMASGRHEISEAPAGAPVGLAITGAGQIENAGKFVKASPLVSSVMPAVINGGVVRATMGTLRFSGAFDNQGVVEALGNSVVELIGPVAQRRGGALTGGVWRAAGNSVVRAGAGSITSNAATIEVEGESAFAFLDTLALSTGSLRFTGGAIHQGAPIGGVLSNEGEIYLGVASGMLLTGGFTQSASGALTLELGGRGPLDLGGMSITGPASLHGSLAVALVNGFAPVWGDEFTMLHVGAGSSGEFDSFSGTPLSDPLLRWWRERRAGEFVVGVRHAGDVNRDLVVNFLDLNAVLGDYGVMGAGLLGDANEDGLVNFIDLNIVLGAYGISAPTPVPAPGAFALLAGAAMRRARRRA